MGLDFLVSTSDSQEIGQTALEQIREVYAAHFNLKQVSTELSLVDETAMREFNFKYRQIDQPTDVLSFPTFNTLEELCQAQENYPQLIGSILICPGKAAAYEETLPQLVHHGLLHLLGFDHEVDREAWCQQETELLAKLQSKGLIIKGGIDE